MNCPHCGQPVELVKVGGGGSLGGWSGRWVSDGQGGFVMSIEGPSDKEPAIGDEVVINTKAGKQHRRKIARVLGYNDKYRSWRCEPEERG